MEIFLSGIPRGLDPFSVSQHIRQIVETVAQVLDVWVHPTKGYGFITLFDVTSTDSVLNLHNTISVNGGIVKLRRSQKQHVKKPIHSPRRINTFVQSPYSGGVQSYGQSEHTNLGGYTTYQDYQRDRPCPDTLYNYVQQVHTRKNKKNQPWNDVTRRSSVPTPHSGSTGKIRRRHYMKRKKTNSRNNKREVRTSKKKLCISTYQGETTTNVLPLNRKCSNNNQQRLNFPGLKNMKLATDVLDGHLVVDLTSSKKSKSIQNLPLDPLVLDHMGSGDSQPIKHVPLDQLVLSHPGPRDSKPIEIVPLEKLVVYHQDPGDINPITNIPGSYGVVDHSDDKPIENVHADNLAVNKQCFGERNFIIQDVPLDQTLTDNFVHPSVFTGTDENNIRLPLVNVHLYDHSKYLFSANIANNLVIESLGYAIMNQCKIPPNSYILIYNGKVLNQTSTPTIENESNIHIVVTGKGGMKDGDLPETKLQYTSTENDNDIPTGQQADKTERLSSKADTGMGDMKEANPSKTMQQCTSKETDGDITTGQQTATTVYSRSKADNEKKNVKAGNPSETIQKPNISENDNDISQAEDTVLQALGLKKYFPNKLTKQDVMCISDDDDREPKELKDIPWVILRKIIMLDISGRDRVSSDFYEENDDNNDDEVDFFPDNNNRDEEKDNTDEDVDLLEKIQSKQMKLHPIDIFLSTYLCLHPILQQHVCTKMFTCHLAVPFMYRHPTPNKPLMLSLWPFRNINVNNGERDISIINCKQHVISFVRLGRPNISKSAIANLLLSANNHHNFFNIDCPLGNTRRIGSIGLVEAAWFIPSAMARNQELSDVAMLLNLRGDLLQNQPQMNYLKNISDVVVVAIDDTVSDNISILDVFKSIKCNILFLVSGKMSNQGLRTIYSRMKSIMPDKCLVHFVKTTNKEVPLGNNILKSSVLKHIKVCLKDNTNTRTFFQVCNVANEMNLVVDEFSAIFSGAKENAYQVFKNIEDVALVDVRPIYTKLQVGPWKGYIEEKRKLKKDNSLKLMEKDTHILKMRDLETSEPGSKQIQSEIMKSFIRNVINTNDIELVYFLGYLIFYLDENFRIKIAELRSSLLDTLKSSNYESKLESENAYRGVERDLSDASFGIEHLFREMGLLYETKTIIEEEMRLAKAVAKTILLGFPFEVMDGDVGDIPLKWVNAVFNELNISIGGKNVFTLSVIGLQSSGKSTLLNAMFGLSFPVSAGRCTRGIYMQLFPVSKEKFKFDYVLVLDTEGLRSPQEVRTQYQRDNELATLAIGMADLCIVNIKGENTSEVHNILQICVHAFLRLKQANAKLCLNQSCIFTHQNVSATNVSKALVQQRMNLEETLDTMTHEAAQQENMHEIKHFNDVIGFDCKKHIWYFPDLFSGNPPMASVNPGYSSKAQTVKSFIFQKLVTGMTEPFQNISDVFIHLNDLWNGILANDFVFSFRNTLELKAYKALDKRYEEIILQLEISVLNVCDEARLKMHMCSTVSELDKEYSEMEKKCLDDLNGKIEESRPIIVDYFDKADYKELINKWKTEQMIKFQNNTLRAEQKMFQNLQTMYVRKKDEIEIEASLANIKGNLTNEAHRLANEILARKRDGDDEYDAVVKKYFDEMWDGCIMKFNMNEDRLVDIDTCLRQLLFHVFRDKRDIVEKELSICPSDQLKKYKRISNAVDIFAIDSTFVTVPTQSTFKKLLNFVLQKHHTDVILKFTKSILKPIDTKLDRIRQKESKFDETEIKQILRDIRQVVEDFNHAGKDMSFLEPYTIRVSVFVCKFALPILTELDVKYIEKHSLKAQLDLHKTSVFEDFTDLVNKKKTVSMATTRLCDRIRPHICEHIRQDLLQKIRIYTLEKCPSKEYLIVKIMTELAQNNQFAPYMAYIHDPYSYALEWLEQFGNDLCFEEPRDFYYHNAKVKMESLLSEIKVVVRSNEEKGIRHCLSNIDEKLGFIKPFLDHYLKQLGDETDLDTSDFKTTFLEEIDQMYDKLKKEFRAVNKATITWPLETPYKSVLDHIWGCNSDCPFCLEPCILGRDHEKMVAHRCIQHRPTGLKRWFWEDSDKLSIENCNVEVGTTSSLYKCGHICTRGRPEHHKIDLIRNFFDNLSFEKYHAYKDYKKFFPDWDIVPHSDMSSSVYWAWVLCQFNAQFAAYYEKMEADIPASWTLYTKEDAINSLPILDNS